MIRGIRTATNLGSWNARGLLQAGKLWVVEMEMEHHNILLLCEIHWRDNDCFTTSNCNTVFFSDHEPVQEWCRRYTGQDYVKLRSWLFRRK